MADPTTLSAGVGMASSAAGSILGGIGASESASATAGAYRYKAGVALLNKQISEQNARWALDSGGISATESGMKSRQEIAGTKVAQASSGFDVNTGTSEAVRESQNEVAAFDQNVIRWDAAKTSYGYHAKAVADQSEADMDFTAARNAEKAGELAMITSFVSGAGGVASKWMQGKAAGIGTS